MENAKNPQMNKMAAAPVNRLMLSMGIPMIISMMLQAVYNIVDSAFVSNMAALFRMFAALNIHWFLFTMSFVSADKVSNF